MKALTLNNKIMVQGSKVLIMPSLTEGATISFNVRGTCFPDRNTANASFRVNSSLPNNKMYINFGDGTGEHEYETSKFYYHEIMHYFQDLKDPSKINTIDRNYNQERTIYIRFDKSQSVTSFEINNTMVFGGFPSGLGFFNLDILRLNSTREITNFPTNFKGGRFKDVYFNNAVKSMLKIIPEWISISEIENLTLLGIFDLSASAAINGLDKIKDVLNLEALRIGNSNIRDISIPTNLKEAPRLKVISLRGDYVTLPKGITDCERCEKIELSDVDGNGYGSVQNWGDGVTKMTKLISLTYFNGASYEVFPPEAPTGIENCPRLRNVKIGSTYRALSKVNGHVMSWLSKLNSVADKKPTALNSFRTVAFDMGTSINANTAIRPSGIYQAPSGFVLGQNNGTPSTAMEAIYVFVKQWGWTVTVRNEANTGTEIFNP